jgi:phospholipase/lecithinase/hemolysin
LHLEALEDRTVLSGGLVGNMVIFGDSLSDTGNAALATGGAIPNPALYSQGRFSNGPIWVDTLAKYLGEPAVRPSLAGGLDYAFGGATVAYNNTSGPFAGVPKVPQQVGLYLSGHTPAANDLFVLWGGANDFFDSVSSPTGPISPIVSADTLAASLGTLAGAGARQFVVANLPPLGETPFISGLGNPALSAAADLWTAAFDGELAADVASFQSAHPSAKVVSVDVAGLFQQATQASNPFGFANTTDAVGPLVPGNVFLSAITATNPQNYLFFDGVHPTSKTQQLIGLTAAAEVYDALDVHHLVVTSTADSVDPTAPGLSLREMVNLSNAMNGQQAITFDLGAGRHQITLGGQELAITQDLLIQGPGAGSLTVSGNSASRVFDVGSGATVTIAGLTIAGGSVTGDESGPLSLGGGGILNEAGSALFLTHDVLKNNTATAINDTVDVFGGGLLNEGNATVVCSTFIGNQALGGGGGSFFAGSVGGGIDNYGGATLTVTDSTFTGNQAIGASSGTASSPSFGIGGAIESNAGEDLAHPSTATISDCAFTDNLAGGTAGIVDGNGGAIDNEGPGTTMTLSNSTLRRNTSGGTGEGLGGGLMNFAGSTCDVLGCVLIDNLSTSTTTGSVGGGIINFFGTMTVGNSTIEGNRAVGGAGGPGIGGGINNFASTLTVTGSTFADNEAIGGTGANGTISTNGGLLNGALSGQGSGGGISNIHDAVLTVQDCTFTGNQAIGGADAVVADSPTNGGGVGGGIENLNGSTLTLLDSTLTDNVARGGSTSTGAGSPGLGGGIENSHLSLDNGQPSTLTMTGCTLAGNQAIGGNGGGAGGFASGGGLDESSSSSASVIDSVFSGNQAVGGNGGSGANGGSGVGGGIDVGFLLGGLTDNSLLTLTGSTLDHNLAQGGDGGRGGDGGDGLGGGLAIQASASASVSDSSITQNKALGGEEGAGGSDGHGIGGGVYNLGTFTDLLSVIKKNRASTSNDNIFS